MANAKVKTEVTMKNIYEYEVAGYVYWKTETRYIYTMVDADGNVYVWKTGAFMTLKYESETGWDIDSKGRRWDYSKINKGDVITITASVKGVGEYKGQPQTELTRVKVIGRSFTAETDEERAERLEKEREAKAEEQRNSLVGEDFIWQMPYRQYKEHYSDCETVAGSFKRTHYGCVIDVIVREGRLKPSGVRGETFQRYAYNVTDDGKTFRTVYVAVNEDNALKRLHKDYPNATKIEPKEIYYSGR